MREGERLGRFEVRALLGRGGMGEVWVAWDPELSRKVAIKLLPTESADDAALRLRFRQEARAASALNHPNIVTVHEVGTHGEVPYIAMELVEGTNLRQLLAARRLGAREALDLLAQVASALAAAEAAGIVHRDVKPENVMLRPDGLAKVLDFGLARRAPLPGADDVTLVSSRPETVVGTVAYMSPEQLRGQEVDARTDVWSAGVLLFEMLAGRSPFRRETAADTISAILEAPLPPVDAVEPLAPEVRALLSRALAKERGERIPGAAALLAEVKRAAQAQAGGPRGESGPWREIATKAASTPPSRPVAPLPVPPTRFVGRETETAALLALLRDPEVRLVTLTGPGGTGKTRLALHAAAKVAERPVFFVPLGSVEDPALVLAAVARHAGVAEALGAEPLATLKEALVERSLLLVLDNFEHVLPAAPAVGELVAALPGLKVLVTSRAALRLSGERELFVPPLKVPDPENLPALHDFERISAVALFVSRAKAVSPEFAVAPENARAVAEICRRLEGLPLALELAAARVKLLPPRALAARLTSPLGLLTGGAADLPARQRTMRATIAWGVDLLSPGEKALFHRLTVFVNGFGLEEAEEVVSGDGVAVLDGIGVLLDNSLLRREEGPAGEPRYRMLSTIREYGLELLAASGEEEAMRRRHAGVFLRMAEEAEPALDGEGQQRWLARLEREHDNLDAALRWAFNRRETDAFLRLVAALWRFWYLHGRYGEGRGWQKAALALPDGDPEVRRRALVGAGALAYLQCDYPVAEKLLEESLLRAREAGDLRSLAASLQYLGSIARERGRHEESVARHRESLELWRALGDEKGVARSLNYIGFASWLNGDLATAAEVCPQALAIFRRLRDVEGTAWALLSLASAARYAGDAARARELAQEALLLSGDAGYVEGSAWSFDVLGNIAREEGYLERSGALLARALDLHRELGDRWRMASVADGLAALAERRGAAERASRLLGAAQALRDGVGTPIPAVERPAREATEAALREALGAARFGELLREGRTLPLEQALA